MSLEVPYVRDVSNLLLVLLNIGAAEDAGLVEEAMENDMLSRGVPDMVHQVRNRIA